MVFPTIFMGLGKQYLTSAARSYAAIAAMGGGRLANFNAATLLDGREQATVELTNLIALEKQLKELGPELFNKFKQKGRKIGVPARDAVRKRYAEIGPLGPLGMPRRPGRYYDGFNTNIGRLAWSKSYAHINRNSGVDVHYKSRNANKALYDLKSGKDGAISVIRVRVRQPALIVADMAGRGRKAMYSQGKGVTRDYQINLFGRGEVTRNHRINRANSDRFVDKLNEKGKGSRYAYPALEKHTPKYRKDVDALLNETIAMINRNLGN